MAGSPVWDACFFVYYFMDEEKVMNEKEKVNQITEGVIWKQLLLFFFPIVFGLSLIHISTAPMSAQNSHNSS